MDIQLIIEIGDMPFTHVNSIAKNIHFIKIIHPPPTTIFKMPSAQRPLYDEKLFSISGVIFDIFFE